MIVIGLTGGIGAGKSTISKRLGELNIPVFDCDAQVHRMYEEPEIADTVFQVCGLPLGSTRQDVAKVVTDNPRLLHQIEHIFEQHIETRLADFIHSQSYVGHAIAVVDAPLLFEGEMNRMCEYTITVNTDEQTRRQRVMSRPGMTEKKLDVILSKQFDDKKRAELADYTIDNNGDVEQTYSQLENILAEIRTKNAKA